MTEADSPKRANSQLYRSMWRWHFYAGIFCIPFLILLALSGSIYLFKPQIESWQFAPYRNLAATGSPTTANQHIDAALQSLPQASFESYRLPRSDREAVIVRVISEGESHIVYVNPFNLQIVKSTPYASQFLEIVKSFHGELLSGRFGAVLVELSASWAFVLIITGIYLWWPRSARGLAGILYPRLRLKGRRLWQDIHAVTGFWVSLFLLFLLVTALPWALIWGSAFKELRAAVHQLQQQDWVVHQHQQPHPDPSHPLDIDLSPEIVALAASLNFAPPAELSIKDPEHNLWQLSSLHQNRPLRQDAWIERHSAGTHTRAENKARLQRVRSFADKSTIDKVIGVGIAAHEGQLFGWLNQLLAMFTTTALLIMSVSAFVLWRKRKPSGSLGAPPPPQAGTPRVIAGIILLCALFLPALLASLIVLAALEYIVLRRIPRVNHWLGISAS